MIRSHSHKQLSLAEFDWPFQTALDEDNRWVKMSECIPWDALSEGYCQSLSVRQGRPAKDARLVIAAVIIKHKLCLSDEETVAQIQENPYLQYFAGLSGYQMQAPFAASLLVEVRKRMGQEVFEHFHGAIIEAVEGAKKKSAPRRQSEKPEAPDDDDNSPGSAVKDSQQETEHQGQLILDATVCEQAIRYPTDLSLLNEAREFSEQIIDKLYPRTELKKKPRSYRVKARKAYLAIAKRRRPGARVVRRGIRQQLQYLRRNLKHIEGLLAHWPVGTRLPLPRWLLYRYWVIQHLYAQQWQMYCDNSRRCDDRIVSISQPYVRPIVRGKQSKPVEFGAKLSVSLNGQGLARVQLKGLTTDSNHNLREFSPMGCCILAAGRVRRQAQCLNQGLARVDYVAVYYNSSKKLLTNGISQPYVRDQGGTRSAIAGRGLPPTLWLLSAKGLG